ncbi:MAG TPA: hypothetical protein VL332_04970 [Candidatus Saccharimonadaceae bacterium]|nr:hypothetical protein [Candidatus Saccharimonadaceae bacterium]
MAGAETSAERSLDPLDFADDVARLGAVCVTAGAGFALTVVGVLAAGVGFALADVIAVVVGAVLALAVVAAPLGATFSIISSAHAPAAVAKVLLRIIAMLLSLVPSRCREGGSGT